MGQHDTEMVHWMQVSMTCEGPMTWCHDGRRMEGVVKESFLEAVHEDKVTMCRGTGTVCWWGWRHGSQSQGSNSSCGAVGIVAGCFTESSSQDPDVWSVALQGVE